MTAPRGWPERHATERNQILEDLAEIGRIVRPLRRDGEPVDVRQMAIDVSRLAQRAHNRLSALGVSQSGARVWGLKAQWVRDDTLDEVLSIKRLLKLFENANDPAVRLAARTALLLVQQLLALLIKLDAPVQTHMLE